MPKTANPERSTAHEDAQQKVSSLGLLLPRKKSKIPAIWPVSLLALKRFPRMVGVGYDEQEK
jgi:hypothetical protein